MSGAARNAGPVTGGSPGQPSPDASGTSITPSAKRTFLVPVTGAPGPGPAGRSGGSLTAVMRTLSRPRPPPPGSDTLAAAGSLSMSGNDPAVVVSCPVKSLRVTAAVSAAWAGTPSARISRAARSSIPASAWPTAPASLTSVTAA